MVDEQLTDEQFTAEEWKKWRREILKKYGSSEAGVKRLLDNGFGPHSEIRDENGNVIKEFS